MPQQPDFRQLIQLARSGDTCALGMLLDEFRGWLRVRIERQLSQPLARRIDASDIVQHTMLEATRDIDRFHGETSGQLAAWLEQIAQRNVAEVVRNHTQTAKRAIARESLRHGDTIDFDPLAGVEAEQSSPSQRAMRGEEAVRLAAALEHLPADQREAVRLRHIEGWSLDQIARRLERSPAAAAGLIKRGLARLREILAKSDSSGG